MGVLKKEISDKHHDLFITQTQAAGSKSWGKDLKSMDSMDSEAQMLNDTSNIIGFYVSCHLGLAFSHRNLI
jgi:hypothetical protein